MSRVTRRNPTAGARDVAQLAALNLTGARRVVAAQFGQQYIGRQYTGSNNKTLSVVCGGGADYRLLYTSGWIPSAGAESDISNTIKIKNGVSLDAATFVPVMFSGRQFGQLDPGGSLLSDPFPFDLPSGATQVWVSTFLTHDFGVSTTLAAPISIGATTTTINALPPVTSGWMFVGVGSTGESVNVYSITGAGPTYTVTLVSGQTFTKVHSSGDFFGMQVLSNNSGYADRSEGTANFVTANPTDRSYIGGFGALSATTTTIAGGSTIAAGSQSVPLAALLIVPSLILGSGGTLETVTIKNVIGTVAPFTAYLTAPTAFSHPAGETVTAAVATAAVYRPTAIVCDRPAAGSPATVVGVGTSIMAGTGHNIRGYTSYATLAFDQIRPFVNLAIGGEQLQTFVSATGAAKRKRLFSMGDWLLSNFPTNDLANSRSLAQIQTDTAILVGWARDRGMRVALETCLPRTTSSDAWATVGNQTVPAWESVRLAYNSWVRGLAGGLADLVVDVAAKVDSGLVVGGAETGKWLAADPTWGPYTSDGVHPSATGHVLMAAAINPAWFS